jgi:hypothetical protein
MSHHGACTLTPHHLPEKHTENCVYLAVYMQGTAGSPLTSTQLLSALQSHSLFVYMGHGSGEQYLSLAKMRRLQGCATDLLMGCSSGRLRQHGRYGPAGAVLSYLVAGKWRVLERSAIHVMNCQVGKSNLEQPCRAPCLTWVLG